MTQYRKKPIVVEAFQLTEKSVKDITKWPQWLLNAYRIPTSKVGSVWVGPDCTLRVATLEGVMVVTENDYIIQGINGELYPCKPDIFDKTYDAVGSESDSIFEEFCEPGGCYCCDVRRRRILGED